MQETESAELARLRALVASLQAGVVVVQDGVTVGINPAAERLLGVVAASVVGRPLRELLERARLRSPGSDPGELPEELHDTLRTVDLPGRGLSVSVAPLGEGARALVIEPSTHAAARQFQLAAECVPGLICSYRLAADGSVQMPFATDAAEDLYGVPAAELARDFTLVSRNYHPDDVPELLRGIEASAREQQPWHGAFRYHHPVKGLRWIEGWSRPQREPEGGVLWHGFVMDVTERHLVEQGLRDREEQLRSARRLESIGRLAGGVAHDFNHLLTVILSCADLASGALGSAGRARAEIDQIRAAAERASALTRQLLAFSRRQVLELRPVDLDDACARALGLLERVLGEQIAIVFRRSAQPVVTRADPAQLEQAIVNLAINARDAMPGGGRLLLETGAVTLDEAFVRDHPGLEPGPYALLLVADTGVGMDRETLARAFEPFFTTRPHGGGTGLGLSSVYGAVRQSGGTVTVESELGRGTTFRIYLPRVLEAPEPPEAPRPGRPPGTETVLVVEDEDAVRRLVGRVLKPLGYEVLLVRDPEDALELASQRSDIALLLTDVILPGMSGRELAERLSRSRPEIRVLYMSGYTDDAIVHHGVLDEGVAFLAKPFTPSALATRVRAALDGRR